MTKTKKQARTDQLNRAAFQWQKHLQEHYSDKRLTASQVQYYLDKAAIALVDLDPSKLSVKQIQAVISLMSSAANCAHTCGVELGKSFGEGN